MTKTEEIKLKERRKKIEELKKELKKEIEDGTISPLMEDILYGERRLVS